MRTENVKRRSVDAVTHSARWVSETLWSSAGLKYTTSLLLFSEA